MLRALKRTVKAFILLPRRCLYTLPPWRDIARTRGTAAGFTFRQWVLQKCFGFNSEAYWPMHFSSVVSGVRRIKIGIGTAPGLSPGCYIQGGNGIEIGDYTIVAPNVGLISAGHSPYDLAKHDEAAPMRIGRYCWIGMNAVILPGVQLGDHTVVAAGAVVTKSFPDGFCIIGGVPARVLKRLDQGRPAEPRNQFEYLGYHAMEGREKDDVFRRLGVEI